MNKNITLEDRINKKALEMFSNNGFDSVTVNHICKEVGITKPTFYRYVSSKEEILDNYFHFDPWESCPNWDQIDDGNIWAAVERGFVLCYEHYLSMGTEMLSRLIMSRISRGEFSFQDDVRWNQTILRLIEQAQEAGQIQDGCTSTEMLDMLLHVAQGYCFYTCTEDAETHGVPEFTEILRTAACSPAVQEKAGMIGKLKDGIPGPLSHSRNQS